LKNLKFFFVLLKVRKLKVRKLKVRKNEIKEIDRIR